MSDEPTLGEVMRQVQALVRQVESLVKEVRVDYIRKEVYDAKHTALIHRVNDIESEANERERKAEDREKARLAFQRQIIGGIIVGVFVLLVQTALTVALIIGGIK